MKSSLRGKHTSATKVTDVSKSGFVLTLGPRTIAVSFTDFPFFRTASDHELRNVQTSFPDHIRWPSLDVDLEFDALEHPARFPLVERRLRSTQR